MHWRERERGIHTHWSKEYGEVIFFLLLQSVTIKSCHIPMTSFFWWRKHIIFSYSHQTNNATSNFLNVFFLLHAHILYTNKIDVAIKKSSFTHTLTHTRAHSVVSIRSVLSHVTKGSVPHTHVRAVLLHAIVMWRLMIFLGSSRHWDGLWRRRRRRRRRRQWCTSLLLYVTVVVGEWRLIFLGSSRRWDGLWRRRRRRRRRRRNLLRRHCLEWERWRRRHDIVTLALGIRCHVRRNGCRYQWHRLK